MPTYYTALINEGKVNNLEEFALECSRAFGVLAEFREDLHAKIPETFEISDYLYESLEKAKKELEEFESLTDEEVEAQVLENLNQEKDRLEKYLSEKNSLKVKYENMLSDVNKWVPPTDEHTDLKEFMIEQLKTSIIYDCDDSYEKKDLEEIENVDIKKNAEMLHEQLKDSCDYYASKIEAGKKRAADKTDWMTQLRNSLKNNT